MFIEHSCIIIAIGTELTEGQVQDRHLGFLAPQLKTSGLAVIRSLQIPDHQLIIKEELERAASECDVLIITGGLGPTSDDITREVVAETAGVKLILDESYWDKLKQRFTGKLAVTNKKQALIPAGFKILRNLRGTAPGFYGKLGKCLVFVLPGPPAELQPMFSQEAFPLIKAACNFAPEQTELNCVSYLVFESELEAGLQHCRFNDISWRTRLEPDRIVFTIQGKAEQDVQKFFKKVQDFFGKERIRQSNKSMAQHLFELLTGRKKTIGFAESCTGGLLGKLITDLAGSSQVFQGGYVVYSNQAKCEMLGVPGEIIRQYGAVSSETVTALCRGVINRLKCDYSLAVSGIAGPGGGTPEKPVGTVWIGWGDKKGEIQTEKYYFTGDRVRIRQKAAVACFLYAERMIIGQETT